MASLIKQGGWFVSITHRVVVVFSSTTLILYSCVIYATQMFVEVVFPPFDYLTLVRQEALVVLKETGLFLRYLRSGWFHASTPIHIPT